MSDGAFSACKNIETVFCYAKTPPNLSYGIFDSTTSSRTLHIPVGCGEIYANSSWKQYFNLIIADLGESEIIDINEDTYDIPIEYYNLQGIRIYNPEHGVIYLRRQGTKIDKIVR